MPKFELDCSLGGQRVDSFIAENGDMLAPGQRLLHAGGSLVHVQKIKGRRQRGAAG